MSARSENRRARADETFPSLPAEIWALIWSSAMSLQVKDASRSILKLTSVFHFDPSMIRDATIAMFGYPVPDTGDAEELPPAPGAFGRQDGPYKGWRTFFVALSEGWHKDRGAFDMCKMPTGTSEGSDDEEDQAPLLIRKLNDIIENRHDLKPCSWRVATMWLMLDTWIQQFGEDGPNFSPDRGFPDVGPWIFNADSSYDFVYHLMEQRVIPDLRPDEDTNLTEWLILYTSWWTTAHDNNHGYLAEGIKNMVLAALREELISLPEARTLLIPRTSNTDLHLASELTSIFLMVMTKLRTAVQNDPELSAELAENSDVLGDLPVWLSGPAVVVARYPGLSGLQRSTVCPDERILRELRMAHGDAGRVGTITMEQDEETEEERRRRHGQGSSSEAIDASSQADLMRQELNEQRRRHVQRQIQMERQEQAQEDQWAREKAKEAGDAAEFLKALGARFPGTGVFGQWREINYPIN